MVIFQEHMLWYEREGDEFLDHIFKENKSRCLHSIPKTKCMSQQWNMSSSRPKQSCAIPSDGKVMLTLFINHLGPGIHIS